MYIRQSRRKGVGKFHLEFDEFGAMSKHPNKKLLWNVTSIHQFSNNIYQNNGNIHWQLLSRSVS